jgi:hypothetical protein
MIFALPEAWNYGDYLPEQGIYDTKEWHFFIDFIVKNDKDRTFQDMVVKPLFLNNFSKYFVDDWCEIYGFNENYLSLFLDCKSYDMDFINTLFNKGIIEICFKNIDAAYWDFFTTNHDMLFALKESLSTDVHCEIREPYFKVNQ